MGSDDTKEGKPLLGGRKSPPTSRKSTPAALEVKVARSNSHSSENDSGASSMRPFSEVFPIWISICRIWFQSEDKWRARGYAAANVALALATTLFLVRISYAQRNFQTALSSKDEVGFYKALWVFVGVICVAVPLFAAADWADDMLRLEWRNFLTKRLMKAYFSNRAFFNLKLQLDAVDNPDQRICDDVSSFVDTSVFLALTFVKKVFNCVAFAGVLWSVAPKLVIFLLAYAIMGTWLTTSVFGRRLTALYFRLLKSEGDLRFDLVRVRENAESIAFYRGEHREAEIAGGRLAALVEVSRAKIWLKMLLSLWQNAYAYATILIPSLFTAPRYFRGEIEFGVISQVGFAFGRIEHALSMLVTNLVDLSGLAAKTERIDALFAALVVRPPAGTPRIVRVPSTNPGIALEGLTLYTPNAGMALCRGLDLSVVPGESLLIVGPSGCGKSSLLRGIAGLWNAGMGRIHTPMGSALFFLPQKPFMPLGTLRQQLVFPAGDASGTGTVDGTTAAASDEELLSLLEDVQLAGLAERVGGLDAELDWAHTLSLGEQQRIAFLRLLLHRPAVAFLDEATAALDEATEAALYSRLARACDCVVSVGHRMVLVQRHTHVLAYSKNGAWSKYTSEEYSRLLQSR